MSSIEWTNVTLRNALNHSYNKNVDQCWVTARNSRIDPFVRVFGALCAITTPAARNDVSVLSFATATNREDVIPRICFISAISAFTVKLLQQIVLCIYRNWGNAPASGMRMLTALGSITFVLSVAAAFIGTSAAIAFASPNQCLLQPPPATATPSNAQYGIHFSLNNSRAVRCLNRLTINTCSYATVSARTVNIEQFNPAPALTAVAPFLTSVNKRKVIRNRYANFLCGGFLCGIGLLHGQYFTSERGENHVN